mmetsp:Transcript_74028/g.173659  ORF Transcript_74028/g.173659 Transcript_74028/m.173659 type:complete len:278 (-) Transcript_74028:940-1773(-)
MLKRSVELRDVLAGERSLSEAFAAFLRAGTPLQSQLTSPLDLDLQRCSIADHHFGPVVHAGSLDAIKGLLHLLEFVPLLEQLGQGSAEPLELVLLSHVESLLRGRQAVLLLKEATKPACLERIAQGQLSLYLLLGRPLSVTNQHDNTKKLHTVNHRDSPRQPRLLSISWRFDHHRRKSVSQRQPRLEIHLLQELIHNVTKVVDDPPARYTRPEICHERLLTAIHYRAVKSDAEDGLAENLLKLRCNLFLFQAQDTAVAILNGAGQEVRESGFFQLVR